MEATHMLRYMRLYLWKSVFKSKYATSLDNTNIKLNTCLKLPPAYITDTTTIVKVNSKRTKNSFFF